MAYTLNSPNNYADLIANDANVAAKVWANEIDYHEAQTDFFQGMEGESKSSLIQARHDKTKKSGGTVVFRQGSGIYGDAHLGSERFETDDDFDELKFNANSITVGYIRNAVRFDKDATELTGLAAEIEQGVPMKLGQWAGREKTWRAMMSFIHHGTSENTVYAGGKLSRDGLRSGDTVTYDEIQEKNYLLRVMGAQPAVLGTDAHKNAIKGGMFVGTSWAMLSLKEDPDYKQNVREGGQRGITNPAFKGDFTQVDGNVVRDFDSFRHDGDGVWGSPLNPEERLGTAITAGTTTFGIKGGGTVANAAKTNKKWFRFFPNFAYRFTQADVLTPSGDAFYVLIVNPKTAATDPGKMGFYKCTTNDGTTLTVTERLAAAASGIAKTTIGGVTWNTGVWADKHTDVHPLGSMIYLANSYGVPIGRSLHMYQCAMRRAYGSERNARGTDKHEGGFITDVHFRTVFNQRPTRDAEGRCPGYLLIEHALKIPGSGIPDVV